MPALIIRPGEDADVDGCLELARIAAPQRTASDLREALLRDVEDAEHHLTVADAGGTVVGYGRARLFQPSPQAPADTAPRGYYLTGVFVVHEHRGRGIGTALTEARLEWIRQRALDAWFFANARNARSIELHRRLGFKEVTRHFSFPGLAFAGGEGILFRLRFHQKS